MKTSRFLPEAAVCGRHARRSGAERKTDGTFEERSGDGTPTGTIVERGVAHSEGRCHGTAHIWIARANEKSGCEGYCCRKGVPGKIRIGLLRYFKRRPSLGGRYVFEGALREIGEELGIHAEAEELRDLGLLEKYHTVFLRKTVPRS